jgi:ABC-type branched-subunit amino acid transport system substrate-binding protein
MREQLGVGRWAVVGNDYIFPRISGATTRLALQGTASSVVSETYVPLGCRDFREVIERLDRQRIDGVMKLLMGQDAVHFNQQFARAGLAGAIHRLSPAVEENQLLAGGAGAHENLYAAAAYFDHLRTPESTDFATAYYARFGRFAPTLNAVGESCYEAIRFLARMGQVCGSIDVGAVKAFASGQFYDSPRGLLRLEANLLNQDVYLAKADGLEFTVEQQIARAV